ncbi:MAG: tRNA (guanine-N7)-methyltransferase [Deltaproteobacteria bacterium]|nr:tRNA (guanine-N7)-methyltransferase [Deltaproteobacteria bacterium]
MHLGLLASTHDVGRDYWLRLAAGLDRVELEIGPGDCGFLTSAAVRRPDTLYVGIEIRPSSVARILERPGLPDNFRLLAGDGRWIVLNLLAPDSIDAYHLYFPDPWWKKRHHKRRLVTDEFAAAAWRTLRPGGCVQVATDVEALFDEIAQALQRAGLVREPWLRDTQDPACGSYERKYRRQGRTFTHALFRKVDSGS